MNAREIAIAAVALALGCLGPTAALVAGMQARASCSCRCGGSDCCRCAGKRRRRPLSR